MPIGYQNKSCKVQLLDDHGKCQILLHEIVTLFLKFYLEWTLGSTTRISFGNSTKVE